MAKYKIAVFVGSARKGSINQALAQALAKLGEKSLEFSFVKIDDLPLYNQDLEANPPAPVARVKGEIEAADGILFVTPEHCRSIPALLKNALDWGSRPWGKNSWPNKPAAIIGASIGAIGTAVAQQHLRTSLAHLGLQVQTGEAYITFKEGLIDASHNITDETTRGFLQTFVDQFSALVARFVTRS